MEEGKLLCGYCGEEVKIVPDFDIELEDKLKESISDMLEDMAAAELTAGDTHEDSEDAFEDDFRDELSDYFSGKTIGIRTKVIVIVLMVMVAAGGIAITMVRSVNNQRYHSFDYQYGQAVACVAQDDYYGAVGYLERALAIHPDDLDVRFLLAKYYDKSGQQQSTVLLLEEILDIGDGYPGRDEVYDMLLEIYESGADYVRMGTLLKSCDVPRIVSKYNQYAAFKPEFSKQGGVYDELISISLKGNAQGFVYYTMDGTVPTSNSAVYETPILLESGEYTIRAIFVNMYGIESETETQHYYISLSAPERPVVNPESGYYTEPVLIGAYHDNDTKVYYTTDGTVPNRNSTRYMDSLEMPYGISNFSFIAIDGSGLGSEVVSRTYQLGTEANFDTSLALQVLRNNLVADGKLLDADGSVPNKPGTNQYRVQTLFKAGENMYYIVYEEYMDELGEVHDTNNIYAVEVNTADLYKAYKVDEGRYDLQPFDE